MSGEGYNCTCQQGFSGKNCEINQDDCIGVVCENGGVCRDATRDYTCRCKRGFSGKHCETKVDLCRTFPCANGGTCVESDGIDFTCACAPGFTGNIVPFKSMTVTLIHASTMEPALIECMSFLAHVLLDSRVPFVSLQQTPLPLDRLHPQHQADQSHPHSKKIFSFEGLPPLQGWRTLSSSRMKTTTKTVTECMSSESLSESSLSSSSLLSFFSSSFAGRRVRKQSEGRKRNSLDLKMKPTLDLFQ